jgi:hypothetical protein
MSSHSDALTLALVLPCFMNGARFDEPNGAFGEPSAAFDRPIAPLDGPGTPVADPTLDFVERIAVDATGRTEVTVAGRMPVVEVEDAVPRAAAKDAVPRIDAAVAGRGSAAAAAAAGCAFAAVRAERKPAAVAGRGAAAAAAWQNSGPAAEREAFIAGTTAVLGARTLVAIVRLDDSIGFFRGGATLVLTLRGVGRARAFPPRRLSVVVVDAEWTCVRRAGLGAVAAAAKGLSSSVVPLAYRKE